jgi:DNA-binding MarR family transcriptional regulator
MNDNPDKNHAHRPQAGLTEDVLRDAIRVLGQLIEARQALSSVAPAGAGTERLEDGGGAPAPELAGHAALRLKAIELFAGRRLREQLYSKAMFGEPAWDILLALYIRDFSDARFTVGALADHVQTPLSTAVRWINYLKREQLIAREDHPTDRRKSFVAISGRGRDLLEHYLSLLCDPPASDTP